MIKVLAIDDEPLALQQLASYVKRVPFFTLSGVCQSAVEAKEFLAGNAVDAIFIDINMPELNGIDFVCSLLSPPLIVFTTAYSEFAVEGFKVDAVDYLLKPLGMDEFMHAARKVKRLVELTKKEDEEWKEEHTHPAPAAPFLTLPRNNPNSRKTSFISKRTTRSSASTSPKSATSSPWAPIFASTS